MKQIKTIPEPTSEFGLECGYISVYYLYLYFHWTTTELLNYSVAQVQIQ